MKGMFVFTKGVRRYLALAILCIAVYTFFNFLSPQIIRFTVDTVIGTEPSALPPSFTLLLEQWGGRDMLRQNLIFCGLAIILCAAIHAIFNFFSRMSMAVFTQGFVKSLRDRLFTHIQRLPMSWHSQNQTGEVIQKCTSDVEVVQNFVANQILQILRASILIVTAIGLMFTMNIPLTLIACAFIPITVLYSGYFFAKIRKHFTKADEAEGALTVIVQENLTGVRVVRAFGRERQEMDRFDKANELYAKLWIDTGFRNGAYWGLGDIMTGLQVLAIITGGVILASKGILTLGEFIVFVSYNQTLVWPIRSLGRVLSDLSKAGVSAKRINGILEAEEEAETPHAVCPTLDGDIEFKNVSFRYENQPVLHKVSFTVEHGTTVGILGATGSGKSTVASLINRLYELPDDGGDILLGGVPLRQIDRAHLRRQVGIVLQNPFLFSKTIAENIAIAHPHSTREEVRVCAAISAIDESINEFANGYDTLVGERGVTLSGGQRQRVAIARTLMQNSPIIIFDDSLSAVDPETDAAIRAAIQERLDSATVILISHRTGTLMHADKILVLEEGQLVESGTHDQLMSAGGIYRRTYDMQLSEMSDQLLPDEPEPEAATVPQGGDDDDA
ncbi:MAG: ABC transporter ATP-binding protein [Angelakisella sp.]